MSHAACLPPARSHPSLILLRRSSVAGPGAVGSAAISSGRGHPMHRECASPPPRELLELFARQATFGDSVD
jgi:hypothetical protein